MKRIIVLAAVALIGAAASPAMAADVGVSVQISQPGVYGRVDIGRFPAPVVVVQQPVVVHRPPPPPRYVVVQPQPVQPVYMWVPPGHQKKWSRHCERYGACGVPVVFVQDRWYRDHVMAYRHGGDWRDDRRARGHEAPRGGGYDRGDDRWEDRRGERWDRGDRRGHGRHD